VSTPDVERLKLAFAWHLCQQVVDADGSVLPEERAFLESHFPREQLVAQGLADADGRWTEAFGPTVEEAFRILPSALSTDEKNVLMHTLREASRSEGATPDAETNVLIVAARILGVRPSDFVGG